MYISKCCSISTFHLHFRTRSRHEHVRRPARALAARGAGVLVCGPAVHRARRDAHCAARVLLLLAAKPSVRARRVRAKVPIYMCVSGQSKVQYNSVVYSEHQVKELPSLYTLGYVHIRLRNCVAFQRLSSRATINTVNSLLY